MKKSITSTYACLRCRKAFKKYRYNQSSSGQWQPISYKVVCPQCGDKAYDAGTAFKAPKQKDIKSWNKLRSLFKNGYRFNPGFGNPFAGKPIYKASQLPIIYKSEFQKPARKRKHAKTKD